MPVKEDSNAIDACSAFVAIPTMTADAARAAAPATANAAFAELPNLLSCRDDRFSWGVRVSRTLRRASSVPTLTVAIVI